MINESNNNTLDLPRWTSQEMDQNVQDFDAYISENPQVIDQLVPHFDLEKSPDYRGHNIRWLFYKTAALDKYMNNKYVHFGYSEDKGYPFIRWLDVDPSQEPQSKLYYMTGFHNLIRKWSNLSLLDNDPNLIAIKQQDWFNIPPRQRAHLVLPNKTKEMK